MKGCNVIGSETTIAEKSSLSHGTLGKRCQIGRNVQLVNAYIWDNVVVGDNTTIRNAIIGNEASIGADCTIGPGSIVSCNVKIANKSTILDNKLIRRKESNAPSATSTDNFSIYQATESDSEDEDTFNSSQLYSNVTASSSTSSISTLTSQLSGDHEIPLATSSRRSSAFSDPSDIEAAQKNRDFHLEATSSILDGMAEGHAPDTIFLELNGYRMSVDAQPHAVLSSVVSAFMKRIAQLTDSGTSAREAVKDVFTKYQTLADRVILDKSAEDKTDQVDFLLSVQRNVAGKPKGAELLLFVAKEVYDLELVEEDGVLQWWEDRRSTEGEFGAVRGLTEQFVTFLKEAEEDESGDEDDEDEEEESE